MARTGKFVVHEVEAKYSRRQSKLTACTVPNSLAPRTHVKPVHVSLITKLEYIVLWLNRLLIGFVTFYLCWMCLRLQNDEIPWHAVLCTVGFLCLMSEGLMAHYRSNAFTQLCERTEKTRTHWLLQLCGSGIGIAGILVKICREDVHFHTLHGKLGLSALIPLCCSLCSGGSALYANELRERLQPLLNKACHNICGLLTYLLAMLSMGTAFDTDIFLEHSLDGAKYVDFRICLKSVIALILILSSYGPLWCLIYSKLWKCC